MSTILLIDEDQAVRGSVEIVAKCLDQGVFVARDGPTGLNVFTNGEFEAVVVDIFLPGLDGLATLRKMLADKPATPIIVVSAHAICFPSSDRPNFLQMAVGLGAKGALRKPFALTELRNVLVGCLGADVITNLPDAIKFSDEAAFAPYLHDFAAAADRRRRVETHLGQLRSSVRRDSRLPRFETRAPALHAAQEGLKSLQLTNDGFAREPHFSNRPVD